MCTPRALEVYAISCGAPQMWQISADCDHAIEQYIGVLKAPDSKQAAPLKGYKRSSGGGRAE